MCLQAAFAASSPVDFVADDIAYSINADGASVSVTAKSPKYTGDVILPESVTNSGVTYTVSAIGETAFIQCTELTSVVVPSSVTSVGMGAFLGCSALTRVDLPQSITEISYYMFSNCTRLASIDIPATVTVIGGNAFRGCSALEGITLPPSLTQVDNYAFYQCHSLKGITIPDSVQSIGSSAFAYCENIDTVVIGKSVTMVGGEAFRGCSGIAVVHSLNPVPPMVGNSMLFDREIYKKAILYIPKGSRKQYSESFEWSDFLDVREGLFKYGDVNGDEEIDVNDVSLLINVMLEKGVSGDLMCPDVNGDGVTDIQDLNIIVNSILVESGMAEVPQQFFVKSCDDNLCHEMVPVWGQEGLFWRMAFVGNKGVEFSPFDDRGMTPFGSMNLDPGSDIGCTVEDNGQGGIVLGNPGWCLLIVKCEKVLGRVQYTLTVNKPIVRLLGTTTPRAEWDEEEPGCEFSVPDNAHSNFVSPELAHDAHPDSGVRMFVRIPGHEWWHSEFVVMGAWIEYRGTGWDQERVVTKAGQKVYLNFNTDTGMIK